MAGPNSPAARAGLKLSDLIVSIDGQSVEDPNAFDYRFATRPLGSRQSALASPQSSVVSNRAWLEEQVKAVVARYGHEVPRPPHWGGYCVHPETIEFWQGRADRLHDRLVYDRQDNGEWSLRRLAP